MLTDFHTKLFAHELTRKSPSGDIERITAALVDSQVDLNPHQVDAALFASRSPLSNGVILADEVGLGKTIEAGIVLSQKWAEGKRRILIILPSSLRKQWHQELLDKFYLPSTILESKSFNQARKNGSFNPFEREEIVLCSYPFARNKADSISQVPWDLVVIDEAHRLRNVYKPQNKIANAIRESIRSAPKLLLTATPLQNSLLELYGLVSFIDGHTFGDLRSFREQFARLGIGDNFDDLKKRLNLVCKRTLRRQVLEYINYTDRKCHTQEFFPSPDEQTLYDLVSDYLQRPNLEALPSSQRSLMTLVLRKLLASSTFAIAGALQTLANKLEWAVGQKKPESGGATDLGNKTEGEVFGEIETDFESFELLTDSLSDEDEIQDQLSRENEIAIRKEIDDLREFYRQAVSITENSKGLALLKGLKVGFGMTEQKAPKKAIIFTESRRTQEYLVRLLSSNGYADQLVLFNGSNNDMKAREIYAAWKEKHAGTDRVSGSRDADTRAALVDYFRNTAKIMIATEAAAEGINLQFCSMVVNYDLPWNPQRIEQRIGRCHRYGQVHDVVVVNFLNKSNAADQRVYQLLAEKFQLFHGVFGASDEVLGTIESGVDFERRIAEIYQTCRTEHQIQLQFDFLQSEMNEQINENMQQARTKLLENFDSEVAEKLNIYKEQSQQSINRFEALLWDLTQHELDGNSTFDEQRLQFVLDKPLPEPTCQIIAEPGRYSLKRSDEGCHHYRLHHPLALHLIDRAAQRELPPHIALEFDYTNTPRKISVLEPLVGQSGWLTARKLSVKSLETEEHILVAGILDNGQPISTEQARRLFHLPADVGKCGNDVPQAISPAYDQLRTQTLMEIQNRNTSFFDEEVDKIDRWSHDLKQGLESEIKELDRQIREAKKMASLSKTLSDKLELQKQVKDLEATRKEKRKRLFDAEDEIDSRRDALIASTETKLKMNEVETELFTIHWRLI